MSATGQGATTTKRAAIYARYSSELQNDRSIEDQTALCRAKAERDGVRVMAVYEDRARSGSSVLGRDGLAAMMAAAKAGAFEMVLVESLDRISRDQEDMAGAYKRLTHWGVDIVAVHDGKADHIQVGIRGIVSALYLTDLAHKVRRGAAGNIREGKHAGGLAYGYSVTLGKPGEWSINEEQAAIVCRIFMEYLRGDSTRDICHRLNVEGVKPPRGISRFILTYTAERKRLAESGTATRAELERKLAKAELALQRTVRAMIESSAPIASFNAEIDRLGAEKKQIETELAGLAQPVNVVSLHPQAVARYLKNVSDLGAMLRAGEPTTQAAAAIRDLVARVTVTPADKGTPPRVDVQGRLEALIGMEGVAARASGGISGSGDWI